MIRLFKRELDRMEGLIEGQALEVLEEKVQIIANNLDEEGFSKDEIESFIVEKVNTMLI